MEELSLVLAFGIWRHFVPVKCCHSENAASNPIEMLPNSILQLERDSVNHDRIHIDIQWASSDSVTVPLLTYCLVNQEGKD